MNKRQLALCTTSLAAAFAVAGCGGGGDHSSTTPQQSTQPTPAINFTSWSKQSVFGQSEMSTPVELEDLKFNFDGDDDPAAYVDVLPAAS